MEDVAVEVCMHLIFVYTLPVGRVEFDDLREVSVGEQERLEM